MSQRVAIPRALLVFSLAPGLALAWKIWHGFPDGLFGINNQLVVRDYLNLWAGGRLTTAGRFDLVFDPDAYTAWLRSLFGQRLDFHMWSYPPHFVLLALPFSALPLLPSFFAWIGATGLAMWWALRAGGLPAGFALAAVLSPAVLDNALAGQNSTLLAGAGLAGGLLLAARRPWVAGALLALLSIKPQLGLLAPVFLIAGGNWRALLWAGLFSAAYVLAGLAVAGWDTLGHFLSETLPTARLYLEAPLVMSGQMMMVSPLISARVLGAGLGVAYAVQLVVGLACAVAVWLGVSRARVDRRLAVALTLLLAPLATPYAHSYDLVAWAVACMLVAWTESERGGMYPRDRLMLGLAWIWPAAAYAAGVDITPGLGPLAGLPAIWLTGRLIWAAEPRPEG